MLDMRVRSPLQIELRELLKLAVPLASAQVAQSATGFADTVMMGRLGADVLAAGGLAAMIFFSVLTAATGVVMGVSPLVAEAFGAGQKARIQRLARQGLWLTVLIAIPTMLALGQVDQWLLRAGQAAPTVELMRTYLDIMVWGLLPMIGFAALRAFVSALSQAQPIMTIVVTGTVGNILGNYALGFGKFGLPQLGLAGLALASVMAQWGMFLALALYVVRHPKLSPYRIFWQLQRLHGRELWQLIWVGVPIGVFTGLETGFFLVIMLWMGTLGTEALAAHQIVLQTVVVVFMVPLGISYATTVRVGQWLGQQNGTGIRQAAGVSVALSIAVATLPSLVFLLFPKQIIGIYLDLQNPDNAAVIAIAIPLLVVAAIALILDCCQKAVYGSLQGLQDTQVPMFLNLLGFWGVGLSVGYVLGFRFGLGGLGLWIGQSTAIAVVAGLFSWRLYVLIQQRDRITEQ
ncbi:MAG: MATE family efflux transporter [Cyanobacteria bacterium P01_H01_bin.121]